METKDLPIFDCSEEERKMLFLRAVEQHPYSCPGEAWVVVDKKGCCEEGFVAWYATFDEKFLKLNPQFRLCWAADYFHEEN